MDQAGSESRSGQDRLAWTDTRQESFKKQDYKESKLVQCSRRKKKRLRNCNSSHIYSTLLLWFYWLKMKSLITSTMRRKNCTVYRWKMLQNPSSYIKGVKVLTCFPQSVLIFIISLSYLWDTLLYLFFSLVNRIPWQEKYIGNRLSNTSQVAS